MTSTGDRTTPDAPADAAPPSAGPEQDRARRMAEVAARQSYGRLLALLTARTRDVAGAEDALAEAFGAALRTWPGSGIPANPEAWLFAVARRGLGRSARHRDARARAAPALALLAEEAAEDRLATDGAAADQEPIFADRRLALLFVCAHPAIDPAVRAPLMLQTVLGLDAARIASAFLVAPAAMGQRLVRAKAKIRDAGIGFEVPEADALPGRLDSVLDAVYTAYGSGWEDVAGADPRRRGLAEEAIWLARLLVDRLPGEPEARGLLALALHCEARRPARRDGAGRFVALADQDPGLWDGAMIAEAEAQLAAARRIGRIGRFQLEAAIQSAHAARRAGTPTPWPAVVALYDGLLAIAPTIGAAVGRAAALAEAEGPAAGLAALERLDPAAVAEYQPHWALTAHLLSRLGRPAQTAWSRAIGLAEDPAVRDFLRARNG